MRDYCTSRPSNELVQVLMNPVAVPVGPSPRDPKACCILHVACLNTRASRRLRTKVSPALSQPNVTKVVVIRRKVSSARIAASMCLYEVA